ncbi:MAG: TerB N-terminal domain-containing protein [Ardenticatenaceae bacterium]
MFRQLLRKLDHLILGKPSRVVVEKAEHHIALSIFKGDQALSLSQLVEHYPPLSRMAQILSPHDDWYIVPLGELDDVKKLLRRNASRGLEVSISAEVNRLREVEIPPNFEVVYFWCDKHECIERYAPENALYFGDGWFVVGDRYWQVESTRAQDDYWLRRQVIEGSEIVHFVTEVIPNWYERQLPYYSYLKYSSEPLLSVTIAAVKEDEDEVTVTVYWKEISDEVRQIPSLSDHVIMADWIMPGIEPSRLRLEGLRTSGVFHLRGEAIPLFVQEVWPRIRNWVKGEAVALLQQHQIFEDPSHLILSVEREYYAGIGLACAVPRLMSGRIRLAAEKASAELGAQKRFVRVEDGWLPTKLVEQAGIVAGGRAADGTPLASVTLTPLEVINRGSERLQGPWERVEFPPFQLQQGRSMMERAYLHLELLRTWGIPGGIIGTTDQYQAILNQFLTTFTTRYPEARVLVLGYQRTLNMLGWQWRQVVSARFDGKRGDPLFHPFIRGVILARPKALEAHPEMLQTEWNILCVLDADRIVKSNKVKSFRLLIGCRKMLTIGLFGSRNFLHRQAAREAMGELFDLPTDPHNPVWNYALRDPNLQPPTLPAPYPLQTRHNVGTPEFTIGAPSPTRSVPIPLQASNRTIHVVSSQKAFFEEAKERVNWYQKEAHFEPFKHYSPTYRKMSEPQSQWYFYWRDQVRKGNYLKTERAYVLVHSYELINNIGVKNAVDGYLQLRTLWLNYREAHPELDHDMIDWLADYVVINRCSIDPLQVYSADEALEHTLVQHPDLLLAHYIGRPFSEMPLPLIEKLGDYGFRKNKFYNSKHRPLLEEYIPKVLDNVNKHMLKSSNEGIFERFRPRKSITLRREPFVRALYHGTIQQVTLTTILPYTQREPLKYLLTGILKETENQLRAKNKFPGRLRNYSVEPAIKELIQRTINPPAPKQKQKIEIDLAEVERLSQESELIFEMLQVEEQAPASALPTSAAPETGDAQATPAKETPDKAAASQSQATKASEASEATEADPPFDKLSARQASESTLNQAPFADLPEEWAEFAAQLADFQFQALHAIMSDNNPSTRLTQIANANATMPEPMIDTINEIALETIGDIIIEAYPTPQIIEEEYLEAIQEIVTIAIPKE